MDNLQHLRNELARLQLAVAGKSREASLAQAEIHKRVSEAEEQGARLRLPHFVSTFELGAFERDFVLLALAPELDPSLEYPTLALAMKSLCSTDYERVQARTTMGPAAPFQFWKIIEPDNQRCRLDRRMADFLLGEDRLDFRLTAETPVAHWIRPQTRFQDLVIPREAEIALGKLEHGTVCLLQGPKGAGKRSAAEALCGARAHPLLFIDCRVMLNSSLPFGLLLSVAIREALLYRAAIYFSDWQDLLADSRKIVAQHAIARFPGMTFLGSESDRCDESFPRFVPISISLPPERLRGKLWTNVVSRLSVAEPIDTGLLARSYRFTPGRMYRVAGELAGRANITTQDLVRACRDESARNLIAFAKRIVPQRTWHDLILPKDTMTQLQELCAQACHRERVFAEWGFAECLSLGKGLIALFTGPSGTGKTLSAEVIANALGQDLYRVDLSCVVSKYIGETEKNLSRIFHDAQESSAILFFDEADSLFGRRTEVRDAHDRYANTEINYLLQRIEEYEGAVVLASNMSNNIDAAFLRRMHFVIEFPFPEEEQRAQIWRHLFPERAPADGIEFDFLARRFKLSGGSIKNVVLAAAFQAAANGGTIKMDHLVLALKREYQKQGKVCEKSEFEHYYELVR